MGLLDAFRPKQAIALPAPAPVDKRNDPSWLKQRLDSLYNLVTGLGVSGRDRRMGLEIYQRQPLVLNQQYYLYQQNWKARRAVEATPRHAVRAWVTITVPDDADLSARLQKVCEKYRKPLRTAGIWANLTGGGLVTMIIDDGKDPNVPVNLRSVRKVASLRTYDRWFSYPVSWDGDPNSMTFGEPAEYSVFGSATVNPAGEKPLMNIHASRCLRLDGPLLPVLLRQANVGWNSSLLEYCWDSLRDHQQGLDSGAKALTAFSQLFISRVGFDQDVVAPGGETASDIRLAILSQQLSTGGVAMLDQTDKIETVSQRVQGFSDLLDRLGDELAGAFEIPRVILYGQANGTTRAGADTDVRMFYDNVKEWSQDNIVPAIRQALAIELATPEFRGLNLNIDDIEIEANSLWELSDKERAEIMKLEADAVGTLAGTGALSVGQLHTAASKVLDPLGVEEDADLLADLGIDNGVQAGEVDPDADIPPADDDRVGAGGMPPLAGKTGLGMNIIPGPDIGPGG